MAVVSVIIPVFNGATTIRETLESVLAQTLSDLEILVINDGSTDRTKEIVLAISDQRVRLIDTGKRNGVSRCRNRGTTLARTELVSFLDADDLWTADKLEAQVDALNSSPEAVAAYSWVDAIDEAGRHRSPLCRESGSDLYRKLLVANVLNCGSNLTIRKRALEEVGGFDESLSNAQDWDLYLKLAVHHPFVCVPKCQIAYRMRRGSMAENLVGMEQSCLTIISRAFDTAPKTLQHLKRESISSLYGYLAGRAFNSSKCSARQVFYYMTRALEGKSLSQRLPFAISVLSRLTIISIPFAGPALYKSIKEIKVRLLAKERSNN